jgi:hypothetical protein
MLHSECSPNSLNVLTSSAHVYSLVCLHAKYRPSPTPRNVKALKDQVERAIRTLIVLERTDERGVRRKKFSKKIYRVNPFCACE